MAARKSREGSSAKVFGARWITAYRVSASKCLRASLWSLIMALMVAGCAREAPATPPVLSDCFAYFRLSAWHDLDGDGLHDETEPPLPGVEFTLKGTFAEASDSGTATTDAEGEAAIDTWTPGACVGGIEIQATAPEGYHPSTDPVLKIEELAASTYTHEFGFMAEDPSTTPAS